MADQQHQEVNVHVHQQVGSSDGSGNGMAVAGLVLGILACLSAFIPVVGAPGAIIMGLIALPLAAVSLAKNKKADRGIGLSIAGLVLSILAFIIVAAWSVLFVSGVNETVESVNEAVEESEAAPE